MSSVITEDETLLLLESRIKRIEERMFGCAPRDVQYPEVISTLSEMSAKLGSSLSTRDRMMAVMKRLDELDEYLDPCYSGFGGTGTAALPASALIDLLLSQEDHWQQHHRRLQQLTQLRPVLDSQPLRDSLSLSEQLVEVSYKQSELEVLSEDQSEKVTKLLHSYNSILEILTETFVNMDNIVTRAEIAARPQQTLD